MSNIIKLPSRDTDNTAVLEEVEKKENSTLYIMKGHIYVRYGTTADNKVFVDPNGGPFMTEGIVLSGIGTIKSIELIKGEGIYIEISNEHISSNTKSRTV